ncbi:MAG TPA: ribonuclease P protein component [Patescibacteria group bacterium]|nr:ribonuclease P protein component [Patescibacteria group bacterium]
MLQKINRLKKKKDFQRVYQSRNRFNLPEMAIQWSPRIGQNLPARFGIVVSNKISKSAVKKNRSKRLIREAIRILTKENKTPPRLDFVINAKKPILDATYQGLYKTLENFFSGQKTIRR